jgi:hypothetical protein
VPGAAAVTYNTFDRARMVLRSKDLTLWNAHMELYPLIAELLAIAEQQQIQIRNLVRESNVG